MLIDTSQPGSRSNSRSETIAQRSRDHEPLDTADGLPSGHHRHSNGEHQPKALSPGERCSGGNEISIQVCCQASSLRYILFLDHLKALPISLTAVLNLSYEWFVPIKWMKTGQEQDQLWLLQKSGTLNLLKSLYTEHTSRSCNRSYMLSLSQ